MKRFTLLLAAVLTLAGFFTRAESQSNTQPKTEKNSSTANLTRFLPVEEVRPGMKGTARTVFAGAAPEEFGVEVLGVLPGYPGPHESTIIARLTGTNVDRTAVFAGMSGSPVFIDGRLVGAIAYAVERRR